MTTNAVPTIAQEHAKYLAQSLANFGLINASPAVVAVGISAAMASLLRDYLEQARSMPTTLPDPPPAEASKVRRETYDELRTLAEGLIVQLGAKAIEVAHRTEDWANANARAEAAEASFASLREEVGKGEPVGWLSSHDCIVGKRFTGRREGFDCPKCREVQTPVYSHPPKVADATWTLERDEDDGIVNLWPDDDHIGSGGVVVALATDRLDLASSREFRRLLGSASSVRLEVRKVEA
jgi:hypothetical protein